MSEKIQNLAEVEKKESNLSPEMQEFVRLPEFIEWFGDWQNDPDNASKMVDENGEPLVVYTGLPAGIKQLSGDARLHTGDDEVGFYFTKKMTNARSMAAQRRDRITDEVVPSSVYEAFLNVRNPYYIHRGDGVKTTRVTADSIVEGADGYVNDKLREIVIFDPGQAMFFDEHPVNF